MSSLEFENDMLKELLENDGLLIAARGVGVEKLLLQLVKVSSEQNALVLVIGTSPEEEKLVIRMLEAENFPVNRLPKQITSDISMNDRIKVIAATIAVQLLNCSL